jgi:polyhydroxybutyrate depolymerase
MSCFKSNYAMICVRNGGTMDNLLLRGVLMLSILTGIASCHDENKGTEKQFRFFSRITVDGRERTFVVNLPSDYYDRAQKRPLVIGLHGAAGSGAQFEKDYRLNQKAEEEGFITVYPDGTKSDGILHLQFWNAGKCCDYASEKNIDDVGFIDRLIDYLVTEYSIDDKRVYAAGMSNGGMMVYRLACELPDRFAALAIVSGSLTVSQPCTPGQSVPILHLHSEKDTKVPFFGGKGIGGYNFHPVDSALQVWSIINECYDEFKQDDREGYTFYAHRNCNNETDIELYLTKDGGHSWPGGLKARPQADEPSRAINANDVIWNFFKRYRRE